MDLFSGSFGFIIPFLVLLTALVFVHELGHYLVARRNGVRVEVFSIGFGREIFGWTDKGGTRWKFSLIPLGGYVKMFGDANVASAPDGKVKEMTEEERAVAFHSKPLKARAWIVAAGPLANFLFAIVLLAGLFIAIGRPVTPAVIGEVQPESAAAAAGLLPEDTVLAINGTSIDRFEDIQRIVRLAPDEQLTLTILRDGRELQVPATPQRHTFTDNLGNEQVIGLLGISRSGITFERLNPASAVWHAVVETKDLTFSTLKAAGQMISGDRSAQELGGPILIAQVSQEAANRGLGSFIWLMAVISINLGLINLFPIPLLDGGHLLFYAWEAIRGRPLSDRAQEYGLRIGLALVASLMLFATWNDVLRVIRNIVS